MCAKIKSIVTFDLEVTSLPKYDGFTTKIMEISFVACSVEHLRQLTTNTIPRVVHKLTICCNPRKAIQDSATTASGLDNIILDEEMQFDENSGNLIKSYFEHLQKPICLIAHNGDSFDFPILAKELKNINVSLPENLLCVDSLRVFRVIDARDKIKILDIMNGICQKSELQQIPNELFNNTECLPKVKADSDNENDTKSFQQLNETTPKRQLLSRETEGPSKKMIRRRLSYDTPERQLVGPSFMSSSTKRPYNPNEFNKGFKLFQIYRRYYNKVPEVKHQAEADAITLLLCIVAAKEDFIQFMNTDAELFNKIKPIGIQDQ